MTKTNQKIGIGILAVIAVLVFASWFGISATTNKTTVFQSRDSTTKAHEKIKTGASARVEYIKFDATIMTEQNFNELNAKFDGKLNKSALSSSTQIVLAMNNHRKDLSAFDYKELSTLDGVSAQEWQQLSKRMGGHHVRGILTFPKVKNPQSLVITGLPVGNVVLTF